jgi:hypothetical protein
MRFDTVDLAPFLLDFSSPFMLDFSSPFMLDFSSPYPLDFSSPFLLDFSSPPKSSSESSVLSRFAAGALTFPFCTGSAYPKTGVKKEVFQKTIRKFLLGVFERRLLGAFSKGPQLAKKRTP